jgi:hypothetical protein
MESFFNQLNTEIFNWMFAKFNFWLYCIATLIKVPA